MLLEQLANLSQIIGTIAVVLTLIYLAVQVRQGSQILRSDSKHAQLGTDQHGVYLFVEHPELSQLYCQETTPSRISGSGSLRNERVRDNFRRTRSLSIALRALSPDKNKTKLERNSIALELLACLLVWKKRQGQFLKTCLRIQLKHPTGHFSGEAPIA